MNKSKSKLSRKKQDLPQKVVIILGAGASLSASNKKSGKFESPPLDKEFLKVADQLLSKKGRIASKHNKAVSCWKEFQNNVKNTGINPQTLKDWGLENLTTYLEARTNVRFQNKAGKPHQHKKALKELYTLICHVLNMCGGTICCELHKILFDKFKPMAIVSFNYDLIADQSLAALDRLPIYERFYSRAKTIQLISKNNKSSSRPLSRPKKGRKKCIPFFKLHGSMHWNKLGRKQGYQIAGLRRYPAKGLEYVIPPKAPFIIPPVAAKMDIINPALHELWTDARKKLSNASTWIIWGYSFPQTDTITTVLLKSACQNNRGKKKSIFIVNPDPKVEERIKKSLIKVNVKTWHSIERLLFDYGLLKPK